MEGWFSVASLLLYQKPRYPPFRERERGKKKHYRGVLEGSAPPGTHGPPELLYVVEEEWVGGVLVQGGVVVFPRQLIPTLNREKERER